jgi:hypothetical protein
LFWDFVPPASTLRPQAHCTKTSPTLYFALTLSELAWRLAQSHRMSRRRYCFNTERAASLTGIASWPPTTVWSRLF